MRLGIAVALLAWVSTADAVNDCNSIARNNPGNPYALVLAQFCEEQETRTAQSLAKIFGKPRPSTAIVWLPAYGTSEAKRLGFACISGTAMHRLSNGWEQLRDNQQRFLRCRSD